MNDPRRDPFFQGLKADIQEGVDGIDHGGTISADEVWAHFERRIAALPETTERRDCSQRSNTSV